MPRVLLTDAEKKERNKKRYEKNKKEIIEKSKKRYEKNKKEILEKSKKRYEKNKKEFCKKQCERQSNNKEAKREYDKEYRKIHKHTEKERKRFTIKNWKLTGLKCDNFDMLYENYLSETHCDLCRIKFGKYGDGTGWFKCMDHDHETGEFRNFLCCSCNNKRGP